MSLSVVLLNTVFNISGSFSMDKFLQKYVVSDFLIANARYFNYEYYGMAEEVQEKNLTESFIEACQEQDGFEKAGVST